MHSTATIAGEKHFDLLSVLAHPDNWTKWPRRAIREVGPASQTLGAMLKLTKRETFYSVPNISRKARLSKYTVRKHLVALHKKEWISNEGRQATPKGYKRRSCTYRVRSKAIAAAVDYAIFPGWACAMPLPWGTKALLAVLMSTLVGLKAYVEEASGEDIRTVAELYSALDCSEPDFLRRFELSVRDLEFETGLSKPTLIAAKRHLRRLGIIEIHSDGESEIGTVKDVLKPREEFRITYQPTGDGLSRLLFRSG